MFFGGGLGWGRFCYDLNKLVVFLGEGFGRKYRDGWGVVLGLGFWDGWMDGWMGVGFDGV